MKKSLQVKEIVTTPLTTTETTIGKRSYRSKSAWYLLLPSCGKYAVESLIISPQILDGISNGVLNIHCPREKEKVGVVSQYNKQCRDPASNSLMRFLDTMGKIIESTIYNRLLPIVKSSLRWIQSTRSSAWQKTYRILLCLVGISKAHSTPPTGPEIKAHWLT